MILRGASSNRLSVSVSVLFSEPSNAEGEGGLKAPQLPSLLGTALGRRYENKSKLIFGLAQEKIVQTYLGLNAKPEVLS